jgi:hypothetical protein
LVDNPEEKEILRRGEYANLTWAELYPTEEAARNKMGRAEM